MSTTQIFDDTLKDFQYKGLWFNTVSWTASNGQSGTLSSTNDQSANFTFTFPVAAVGFRFYGMKRSRGASFVICVGCNPNDLVFKNIDAFDPKDGGQNAPSVLYSQNFSSPSVYGIIVRNQADPRGSPPGNSELTLDRFELDVPSGGGQITTLSAQVGNSVTSTRVTQATQTAISSGSAPLTRADSNTLPRATIVGAALGGAIATAILILLLFWLKKHKLRFLMIKKYPYQPEVGIRGFDPTMTVDWLETSEKDGNLRSEMSSLKPTDRSGSNPTAGDSGMKTPSSLRASPPPLQEPAPPFSFSEAFPDINSTTFAPQTRRQAFDAGPMPQISYDSDDDGALPPEYVSQSRN